MLSAPKILLVTFNWSTLIEMPYLLKQAGCEVHVLCPSNNWTIKNSFYDLWIDSGDSLDTLITLLVKLASNDDYAYILIGDDPILWKIYTENIVALKHLLPIGNASALPILNKVGFAEHCHGYAIPSPKFKRIGHKSDALEAVQYLGLPLVIKTNYSNGGNGVRILENELSYYEFIAAYDFHEPLLAQQYIVGTLIGADALFKNGKLLQYAYAVDVNPTLGPSTQRRYFQKNNEQIDRMLTRLGESALLHGFANISLIHKAFSPDYYLIEADPRPTKWVPYARWFGRDFAVAFKAFLAEGEGSGDLVSNTVESSEIDCWEVEYFPNHAGKLFNQGRNNEAIMHLVDFKRNLRYINYDPVLLEAKMELLRNIIKLIKPPLGNGGFFMPTTKGNTMTTIKIDEKDYELESLSEEAKAQLASLQFVDAELQRLNAQAAVLQTARLAYAKALAEALPVKSEKAPKVDTSELQFG